MTLPRHGCSFLALLRYASAVTAASVACSRFKGRLFSCSSFDPGPGRFMLHADVKLTLYPERQRMEGLTSPARFLAYLMAKHDISITQLCRRSGMDSAVA